MAAMPDGRIAIGSSDGMVKAWDEKANELTILFRHERPALSLSVLPDGRIAFRSSETVKLWDLRFAGTRTIIRHDDFVTALVVLTDGRIASGSRDDTVRLYEPSTRSVRTALRHEYPVFCMAATSDNRIVFGDMSDVNLWDPATDHLNTIIEHEGSVEAVATFPDGRVVSAALDHLVWLRLPGTPVTRSARSYGRSSPGFATSSIVSALAVDPESHLIALGLDDGRTLVLAIEPEASLPRGRSPAKKQRKRK